MPSFLDRGTIIGALPSESVMTPSHVPNLKQNSYHTPILPKGKGDYDSEVIKSIFPIQMSGSSESDSSNRPGCDSDGELSVASLYGSEVRDCRKRPRQAQIQGNSWVLLAQIIMDQLHADSDSMAAGPEGDVEKEDIITKINTRLQGLFGAQFEKLFGKLHGNVTHLVVFCNLINIWDVVADSNDAVRIKIETQGFLQLRKPRAVMVLQKLLSLFAPALSGCWE
jgi:hypothetical protein